ncbi:hypothetical protein RUMOBE_00382 [Blautia obeum ATCC 29174]|uniref:Uncharacterized protein n=1 Tax=Blautia obeum ATCC 29174 TaxID=411459 RepID=A5ZN16_9FIRM|nr:hypothetical protein RUMOBE_00382 [Blautia obeum ATCC 29174]
MHLFIVCKAFDQNHKFYKDFSLLCIPALQSLTIMKINQKTITFH